MYLTSVVAFCISSHCSSLSTLSSSACRRSSCFDMGMVITLSPFATANLKPILDGTIGFAPSAVLEKLTPRNTPNTESPSAAVTTVYGSPTMNFSNSSR